MGTTSQGGCEPRIPKHNSVPLKSTIPSDLPATPEHHQLHHPKEEDPNAHAHPPAPLF